MTLFELTSYEMEKWLSLVDTIKTHNKDKEFSDSWDENAELSLSLDQSRFLQQMIDRLHADVITFAIKD